jgi:hypothetical protein
MNKSLLASAFSVFALVLAPHAALAAPKCDGAPSPEQVCVGMKALVPSGLECRYTVSAIQEPKGSLDVDPSPTVYTLVPKKNELCKATLQVSRDELQLKVRATGDASEGDQVWFTVSGYTHGNCGGKIKELYEKGMAPIESSSPGCDWKLEWADLSQLL